VHAALPVFPFCVLVEDRKGFQDTLSGMGVGMPYHVGYFPGNAYSYADAKDQFGLELSVNTLADYSQLFQGLLAGTVKPLDELK
jgi:hypothetical protein